MTIRNLNYTMILFIKIQLTANIINHTYPPIISSQTKNRKDDKRINRPV